MHRLQDALADFEARHFPAPQNRSMLLHTSRRLELWSFLLQAVWRNLNISVNGDWQDCCDRVGHQRSAVQSRVCDDWCRGVTFSPRLLLPIGSLPYCIVGVQKLPIERRKWSSQSYGAHRCWCSLHCNTQSERERAPAGRTTLNRWVLKSQLVKW